MSERRRFVAIVECFLIGFVMVALADALDAWWPLFLTPLPLAVVPWLVVHAGDEVPGPGPEAL